MVAAPPMEAPPKKRNAIIFRRTENIEEGVKKMKLKPCPFCGGQIEKDDGIYPTTRDRKHWQAGCNKVGCEATVYGKSKKDVIERWNKRKRDK